VINSLGVLELVEFVAPRVLLVGGPVYPDARDR
jgi:hypothetical protein